MKLYIWVQNKTFHSYSMMDEPCLNNSLYSKAAAVVLAHSLDEAIATLVNRNEGWRPEDLRRFTPKVVDIDNAQVVFSEIQ